MKDNIILLFTYGTLQRGNMRHQLLDGADYVGPALTVGRYILKDRGDFPFLVKLSQPALAKHGDEAVRVHGELYKIDLGMQNKLDRIEGHPDFFQRSKIMVESEILAEGPMHLEATVYLITPQKIDQPWYNHNIIRTPAINSGIWNKSQPEA